MPIQVKNVGAWSNGIAGWIKDQGVWKQIWPYTPPPPPAPGSVEYLVVGGGGGGGTN